MQLSQQFDSLTVQIIVSLGKFNVKIAEGSAITCLLEAIQNSVLVADDENIMDTSSCKATNV